MKVYLLKWGCWGREQPSVLLRTPSASVNRLLWLFLVHKLWIWGRRGVQVCAFCSPANKVASDRSSVKKGSRSALLSCCKSVFIFLKPYKTSVVLLFSPLLVWALDDLVFLHQTSIKHELFKRILMIITPVHNKNTCLSARFESTKTAFLSFYWLEP